MCKYVYIIRNKYMMHVMCMNTYMYLWRGETGGKTDRQTGNIFASILQSGQSC